MYDFNHSRYINIIQEILWSGIYYFNRKKKEHCILRTAPFCPALYRSQYDSENPVIIVKEEVKKLLEENFSNLNFVAIKKEKIVELNWQNWDLLAEEPKLYPSGDMDAECYIVNRKHNDMLSETLGNLFALIPIKEGYSYGNSKKLVMSTLSKQNVFIVNTLENKEIYVNEEMKKCLEKNFTDEIYFEEVKLGEPDNLDEIILNFSRLDDLNQKAERLSAKDWSKWHKLKYEAQKLIETIDDLKSDNGKNKRKEKILLLLNKANELYPLNIENWMNGFWKKNKNTNIKIEDEE